MDDDRGPRRRLTPPEVAAEDLADWRLLFDRLHTSFDTGDLATAVALLVAVAGDAEERGLRPELDVTHGRLDVRLSSPGAGGVTSAEVTLAREISALAQAVGATPHPNRTAVLELALDCPDAAEVAPFWSALLDYESATVEVSGGGQEVELRDPAGRYPSIWFQVSGERTTPRQTWHLDVWLPDEVADHRVASALEAGGTLVDSSPGCRVLADPRGNRACVVTWQGRQPHG